MSWVIYIYVLVRYSDLLCIVYNATANFWIAWRKKAYYSKLWRHVTELWMIDWRHFCRNQGITGLTLKNTGLEHISDMKTKLNKYLTRVHRGQLHFIHSRDPTSEAIHRRVQQRFIWGHHRPQQGMEISPGDLMS